MRHTSKSLDIKLDIDRGPDWEGKKLYVQIIGPGKTDPTLLDVVPVTVPKSSEPVISFTVKPSGDWLFLRITDPARKCDPLGKAPFEDSTYGGAAAYASPWFFTT